MNKIGWTGLGTGLLVAGGAGLVAFGSSRWASATQAQLALLDAAMLGLFTVAEVQGTSEIARGELMRFFTEMAWYPTALLPSQGVHCHGMLVPTRGEVAKGGKSYFVGDLTSLVCGYAH